MRTHQVLLVGLLILAAGAAPASAHDNHPADAWGECAATTTEHLTHLCPQTGTVGAGDAVEIPLSFTYDADLQAGWTILFDGTASDGDLHATLIAPSGADVANWTWSATTQLYTATLPETGHYVLRLANPGDTEATYRLFFDQTCECSAKWTNQDDSHIVFNWHLDAGQTRRVAFDINALDAAFGPANLPADLAIDIWTADRTDATPGTWPTDFAIRQRLTVHDDFTLDLEPAAHDGIRYVLAHVHNPAANTTILLAPSINTLAASTGSAGNGASGDATDDSADDADTPAAAPFAVAAGLLAAAARRRARSKR